MILGHLFSGQRIDSKYFLAVVSGSGRGNFDNEGTPLFLARYQWNFLGRDLEFSQSDVALREKPAGSVAVAALTNRSRFTRFDQSGGGELEGFPSDIAEQYDIVQHLAEFAFQHRGLSLQSEYHWKQIDDRLTPLPTARFRGAYAQAGYFFHALNPGFPQPLELAFRAAFVDGDFVREESPQHELTWTATWFFNGHRNKLTLDFSRLSLDAGSEDTIEWRARFQWDVSI